MATLAGQRAQFTSALRQYNLAEDADRQHFYARRMAKYIAMAPANGFTAEEVTQGQMYPVAEVAQYLAEASTDVSPDISDGQALREVEEAVDASDVLRLGEGSTVVYAYGWHRQVNRRVTGSRHTGGMKPNCNSCHVRHRFPTEVISYALWLYFRFP